MELLTANQGLIGTEVLDILPNEKAIAQGKDPKARNAALVLTLSFLAIFWCFFMPNIKMVNFSNILYWSAGAIVASIIAAKLTDDNRMRRAYDTIVFMIPTQFDQIATGSSTAGVGVAPLGVGVGVASTSNNISQSVIHHIEFADGTWCIARAGSQEKGLVDLISNIGQRYCLEKPKARAKRA
jgi:hypothetical protein